MTNTKKQVFAAKFRNLKREAFQKETDFFSVYGFPRNLLINVSIQSKAKYFSSRNCFNSCNIYLTRENELDEDNWPSRHLKSCQKDDILQDVGRVGEEDLGKEMGDEGENCPGEESGDLLEFHC